MTNIAHWGQVRHDDADIAVPFRPELWGGFVAMPGSTAQGLGLVSNGHIGVDLVHLRAGQSFSPHTHPGHHVLIVVRGLGTIVIDNAVYLTWPGCVYIAPGGVAHAVGAIDDHSLLAVGAPHRTVDDPDRAALVEYEAVATAIGTLRCFVCDIDAGTERRPGECEHVPESWQ